MVNKLSLHAACAICCILAGSMAMPAEADVPQQDAVVVKILERPDAAGATISATFSARALPPLRSGESSQRAPCELHVLDDAGHVIFAQKFDFVRYIEVPLPEPGSLRKTGRSRARTSQPEAVLTIPWLPEAASIRVKTASGTSSSLPFPSAAEFRQAQEVSPPPAQSGSFHILLLASGFADMAAFQAKAQSMKTYLLGKEPFASSSASIVVSVHENADELDCAPGCMGIDRLMCCDSEKVMAAAAASGMLHDEIIVIHDTATYSGGGIRDQGEYKTSSASSYSMVYNGTYSNSMALHEFGHSFGNLCDEYTYSDEGFPYYDCANCRASCSDWSAISPGCQLSCDAESTYHRPEDSIMLTLSLPFFNLPSVANALAPRLSYFLAAPSSEFSPGPLFQLLK